MTDADRDDVEIFEPRIRDDLVEPNGSDEIEMDMEALAEAEAAVAALRDNYLVWVRDDLAAMEAAFGAAVADPEADAEPIASIGAVAHNVKGHGASFGYPLMTEVGASLSAYCRELVHASGAQLAVVKAHIDALKAIIENDLSGDGGETGAELVTLLRDAVASRKG